MCRVAPLLGFALAFAAPAGCGSPKLALHPVEGSVQLASGKSAAGCLVELTSQADVDLVVKARGTVGADGRFVLKTLLDGKEKEGAVAGPHKVTVVPPPPNAAGVSSVAVPLRYMDADKTDLKFEVKPGETNTLAITVEAR